jgi:hypothetical protein
MTATLIGSQMAQYNNYADSAESFALSRGGALIKNITDPTSFAATLQDAGLFGINPMTGAKMPNYVSDVENTINGLAIRMNCEKKKEED